MLDNALAIEIAADAFAENPASDDGQVADLLVDKGASRDQAERIVAFLPLVAGRLHFGNKGPTFSDTFDLFDLDAGLRATGRLAALPADPQRSPSQLLRRVCAQDRRLSR